MNSRPGKQKEVTSPRFVRPECVLFCGLISVLLAACAPVGPNFQKPEVQLPEGWLEIADERISPEGGGHRDWWKNFNDPALEALIQHAYENNPPSKWRACGCTKVAPFWAWQPV